jgi:long-chain acyl-CoA synthetase
MDTGKELGVNEIGIGYFYTPARMKEYYGNPQATAHNLVLDENGVVWYNTEDLVHYNERGELFLDGRLRRIAITVDKEGNPAKIIPERIKKEITNNGSVNKCEVITVPDTQRANVAIAFVVKSSDITKENLLAYCGTNLPDYMVPDDVIFVDDIPCTSNKKPDFAELERMYDKNKGV